MRRALLVFTLAALMSACNKPADAPAADVSTTATPAPVMPADAPPQEEVDPSVAATPDFSGRPVRSACPAEIGDVAAARLVARCIAVSPATHPPCNAANPCQMIQDEIDRSCEMIPAGEARPAECAA